MSLHRPCILDIEASGFGASSDPIEVGHVLADGRSRCTLIRPREGWTHWDPRAEALHGISRETLLRHGRPVAEVARTLNADLARLPALQQQALRQPGVDRHRASCDARALQLAIEQAAAQAAP